MSTSVNLTESLVEREEVWMGLCEKFHPKPHDNSNISRFEAEANKLKKKVETIKDTIGHFRYIEILTWLRGLGE